ncbi:MAG TPA: hypothetical protein VE641_17455, partial [Chthoniobacterales bacterium]|nr:hypothetical protein [Chthoniobacterales bacterium]
CNPYLQISHRLGICQPKMKTVIKIRFANAMYWVFSTTRKLVGANAVFQVVRFGFCARAIGR